MRDPPKGSMITMRMRMTMMAMKRIIIINIFRKHGRVKREIKRSPSSKSRRDTSGDRRCAQQDQGDLRLLKERIYSFSSRSDDKEGVWGADGEPGGAAHQDHHGQLHHCHLWGNGDCSVFSIFSRFFPMVDMILHLFFSAFDNNLHLQVSRLANTAKSVVRDLDNGLFRISQVFGNFFFI